MRSFWVYSTTFLLIVNNVRFYLIFVTIILMKPFTTKVLNTVKKIPKGSVLTYKEVAKRAGSPKAFRAVGSILKKNYDPAIPCHRVIKSNGDLGEYNRGRNEKERRLRGEGVKV